MGEIVKTLNIPSDKSVFIVGDIHGDYDLYKKGCKDLGITDEDIVISVGDLTDRGNKNFASVVEFTRKKNRYAVKGNHCAMFADAFVRGDRASFECWFVNGGNTAFDELGEEGCQIVAGMLDELPIVLDITYGDLKLGIIHAGIPAHPRAGSEWNEVLYTAKNYSRYANDLVWDRSIIEKIQNGKHVDLLSGVDYVFHGHTPIKNPLIFDKRVYLDTGGVFNGKLTFAYFENSDEDNEIKFYTTGDWDSL